MGPTLSEHVAKSLSEHVAKFKQAITFYGDFGVTVVHVLAQYALKTANFVITCSNYIKLRNNRQLQFHYCCGGSEITVKSLWWPTFA
jgi:hypothetical protein